MLFMFDVVYHCLDGKADGEGKVNAYVSSCSGGRLSNMEYLTGKTIDHVDVSIARHPKALHTSHLTRPPSRVYIEVVSFATLSAVMMLSPVWPHFPKRGFWEFRSCQVWQKAFLGALLMPYCGRESRPAGF